MKRKRKFYRIEKHDYCYPSVWLSNLVKQSFLKEYPIKVINNGIDLDIFKPTKSDFRKKFNLEDKFIILGVANIWGKRKGYDYFVELSNRIKKDEVIVMVGLTDKQKSSFLKILLV